MECTSSVCELLSLTKALLPGFFLGQFELVCRASKLVRRRKWPQGRARYGGGGRRVRGACSPGNF